MKKDAVFIKRTFSGAQDYLRKRFGKDVLLSKNTNLDIERIGTGFYKFDKSIGGGLPKGRIIEIFGNEGCGKTSFCLQLASVIQKQSKKNFILYLDFENVIDLAYTEALGVSLDEKVWNLAQPTTLEEGIDILGVLAYTGEVGMVIVDSVAAMTPMAELEGSMMENSIGLQARKLGQTFRKMVGILRRTGTICVFINQMRDKIGGYGLPYSTPGGRALKFYASVRIRVNSKRSGYYDEGLNTTFTIVKNKTSLNQGEKTSYELEPGKGFLKQFETFDMAKEAGLVTQEKRSYLFRDRKFSFEQLIEFFKNESIREKIFRIWQKRISK